jgi:Bardet-Biedl syndrome 5 protein
MLEKFLSSVFDEEHSFQDLWELKLIKFDINLEDNVKAYERHLAVSHMVEDMKGNPGQKGSFIVTNLRLIWHGNVDRDLNLSIGLDTITNVMIKTLPIQGFHDLKYVLIVKCLSPRQTKYEFKFSGHTAIEENLFKKVEIVFKYIYY